MPRGSGALRLGAAAGLALQVSALVSCDPNAIGPRQLCPAFNNCPESCAPQEGVDEGMCPCGCPLNYMTRKVADILETCCAGLPDEACGVENGRLSTAAHLPFACTEACANAYLKLYEECGPDLRAGLPPADDTPAWDALYLTCQDTVETAGHCEGDNPSWVPGYNWYQRQSATDLGMPGGQCQNTYDSWDQGQTCADLVGMGIPCSCFAWGAGNCPQAGQNLEGLCDVECGFCGACVLHALPTHSALPPASNLGPPSP